MVAPDRPPRHNPVAVEDHSTLREMLTTAQQDREQQLRIAQEGARQSQANARPATAAQQVQHVSTYDQLRRERLFLAQKNICVRPATARPAPVLAPTATDPVNSGRATAAPHATTRRPRDEGAADSLAGGGGAKRARVAEAGAGAEGSQATGPAPGVGVAARTIVNIFNADTESEDEIVIDDSDEGGGEDGTGRGQEDTDGDGAEGGSGGGGDVGERGGVGGANAEERAAWTARWNAFRIGRGLPVMVQVREPSLDASRVHC